MTGGTSGDGSAYSNVSPEIDPIYDDDRVVSKSLVSYFVFCVLWIDVFRLDFFFFHVVFNLFFANMCLNVLFACLLVQVEKLITDPPGNS